MPLRLSIKGQSDQGPTPVYGPAKPRGCCPLPQQGAQLCLRGSALGIAQQQLGQMGRHSRINRGDFGTTDQGQLTSDERAELARLNKENREHRREKDISGWRQRTWPKKSCRREVLAD